MIVPFQSRLLPAAREGALRQDSHWIWCGSPVRGEDGRYHLFASRWSKDLTFLHWATASEIVRAVADVPEGPYVFEEVVLASRGEQFWDGQVTHNPAIRRHGDQFFLFYTGTTFEGQRPTDPKDGGHFSEKWVTAWHGKRVGVAVADSVYGPWKRLDVPLLSSRPGHWDSVIASNPAPWIHTDGRCIILYKSTSTRHPQSVFPGRFHFGIAEATRWDAEFVRTADTPISMGGNTNHHLEDGFLWWNGSAYELIAKDMTGEVCGEAQAAIHAFSEDGQNWQLAEIPKAYSRTVRWTDGTSSTLHKLERPQLLFDGASPTHLFAATLSVSPSGEILDSYNLVFPLKDPAI
jgi:hypothetical protein